MYQMTVLVGCIGKKSFGISAKSQTPVANYSVVTTKSRKDKQSGEFVEEKEWHRLVSFYQCAEHVEKNLKPGDVVQVQGEWRTKKWQDDRGEDKFMKELVVRDFPKKLPRYYKRDGQAGSDQSSSPSANQAAGDEYLNDGPSYNQFDDDIPF